MPELNFTLVTFGLFKTDVVGFTDVNLAIIQREKEEESRGETTQQAPLAGLSTEIRPG